MNRKLLVTLHMHLAAFFAPFVILVAISGGLYLAGIKGELDEHTVYSGAAGGLDAASASLPDEVSALLARAGVVDYEFDYIKVKGDTLYTRPTSRQHYIISLRDDELDLVRATPSLQFRLVELHKGHGPPAFKTFQQLFALGLLLMIGSGLWLGLSAAALRTRTLLTSLCGLALFLLLALL